MADQPKPKSNRTRNDTRQNGKALKKAGSSRNRKNPQTPLQNALMDKGVMRRVKSYVDPKDRWLGESRVTVPFDKAGVEENKRLYPHLFSAAELRQAS